MDTFTFKVYNSIGGYPWSKEMVLKINLIEYPTSKAATLPMKVKYRICRPTHFKIWPLDDKVYQIGENTNIVEYELDQEPCQFDIGEYHCVQVLDISSEASLPTFIRSAKNSSPTIWFDTQDASDVGSYKIRCYGSMIHEGQIVDSISTDFKLDILPVVKRVSPNDTPTAPIWELGLKD